MVIIKIKLQKGDYKMDKVKLVGNLKGARGFQMDLNGHTLITDTIEINGGANQGPTPKQLLLAGLIGCVGIDVTMILEKMKIKIDDLQISVEADNTEDMPKVYENIHLTFKFTGDDLKMKDLERIVSLSKEKYCGVSAMLEKHTPISYEIIIL